MTPTGYQLAELNIGRLVADVDDARVAPFMAALDKVNAIAERSEGFVWRLTGEGNDATGLADETDARLIPNMSVWRDVASLQDFVFNTVHKAFVMRRSEWFETLDHMFFVMWWVPEGHQPTLTEAYQKLEALQNYGDSDQAFGWSYLKETPLWESPGRVSAAE
jgi:uncharacterized protein DUF3291